MSGLQEDAGDVRVRFKGRDLVWIKDETGDGPLAPLDHIGADGRLDVGAALVGESFAHVMSTGEIMRYGAVIGRVEDVEDLEFLPQPSVMETDR